MNREKMEAFFARTMSSDLLADVLALYRNNPGLVDTEEAVARRLGVSVKRLDPDVQAMKRVGLLREHRAGRFSLLFFDQASERTLGDFVAQKVSKRAKRVAKS